MQHGAILLYIITDQKYHVKARWISTRGNHEYSWLKKEFSHLMCIFFYLKKENICVWIYWVDIVWQHKEKRNKM